MDVDFVIKKKVAILMSFRTLVAEMETSWVDRLRWTESVFFGEHLKYCRKFGKCYGEDLF